MKGRPEALLLLATGSFLAAFPFPIVELFTGAGLALGARDLLRDNEGWPQQSWLKTTCISAWSFCGFSLLYFFWPLAVSLPAFAALAVSLFAAATSLSDLARESGEQRLARQMALLRIPLILFLPMVFAGLPAAGLAIHVAACIALAALTLKLRSLYLPYGAQSSRPQP